MFLPILVAVLFQAVPQSAPSAAGTVAWTQPAAEPAPVVEAPPPPALPDWALADPFAWERAQCSSLVRGDETLDACQARVRTDLAANLGDRLPAALRPPILQECRRTADGFAVDCGPPARADRPTTPLPREQDCGTRMTRTREGAAVFDSSCRPGVGEEPREGLTIRLGGD